MRLDNAPELVATVDDCSKSSGIRQEPTVPYTSNQNGIAERGIQTTENNIRAMCKDSGLGMLFWDEAAKTDAHIRNLTAVGPEVTGRRITPYEDWTQEKPSIDHLRVWGCRCYVCSDPKSLPVGTRQDKFMDRGKVGIFLGYSQRTNRQYRVYTPDTGRIIRATTVTFDEWTKGSTVSLHQGDQARAQALQVDNTVPTRKPIGRPPKEVPEADSTQGPKAGQVSTNLEPSSMSLEPSPMSLEPSPTNPNEKLTVQPSSMDVELNSMNGKPAKPGNEPGLDTLVETSQPEPSLAVEKPQPTPPAQPELAQPTQPALRRSTRAKVPTLKMQREGNEEDNEPVPLSLTRQFLRVEVPTLKRQREDDNEENGALPDAKHLRTLMAYITELENQVESVHNVKNRIPIPKTYQEAMNDPVFAEEWKDAMDIELEALIDNSTWMETIAPADANLVSSRWVFDVKYNSTGEVERHKARLVARGFSQIHGVDYEETFAPTVRTDSIRLPLALIGINDWEGHQIDISNAFTNSKLKEEIYMKPPSGLRISPGLVLLLKRSLYGLKQGARDWNENCAATLLLLGFRQCLVDPCIFIHCERRLLIALHVDDMLIGGPHITDISWFKEAIAQKYKVKDLGEVKKIIGIRVIRDRANRTIHLDQEAYLEKVLQDAQMLQETSRPTRIPMNGDSCIRPAGPEDDRVDRALYQKNVGSVMYAAINTRPDISFAVGKLSQYVTDPAKHHEQAMKYLLRYLRSTIKRRLTYRASGSNQVTGYTDASYAADRQDRKSTMGTIFLLGGGPISWSSRKQKSVSTSTTEAEYMAPSSGAKQAQWLSHLLRDIGFPDYVRSSPWTMELRGDNTGSIALVKNPCLHDRSKHIDVAYHFARDLQRRGRLQVTCVPTEDMIADGLTKPLPTPGFEAFVKGMGMLR